MPSAFQTSILTWESNGVATSLVPQITEAKWERASQAGAQNEREPVWRMHGVVDN
jgi:hypothetical protein